MQALVRQHAQEQVRPQNSQRFAGILPAALLNAVEAIPKAAAYAWLGGAWGGCER